MITTLDRLDQRKTSYRFDLARDIPWQRLSEPGLHFPASLLRRLGFDPEALAETLGARASLDALLALSTAEIFRHLETDVIRFVEAQGQRRPSASAGLLVEEERKHVELFTRLAAALRQEHPAEARALAPFLRAPPSFDRLLARAADYASPDELAFTFWLNTVFFEEYTVFFHHALEEHSLDGEREALQPVWLAAHRCHRQEELQHVLTDAAYLRELPLDDDDRRRLSKSFFFFLDESFGAFFGIDESARALAALYPGVRGLPKGKRFYELPLFQDVLRHRAFRHTRQAAPFLAEQVPPPSSTKRPALVSGGAPALAPSASDTLTKSLEAAARDDVGVVFAPLDGGERALSYATLLDEADARLARLNDAGARAGDAVVLLTSEPATTVPWFWACLRGGLVPAPLALPVASGAAEELQRLLRVHRQLGEPWLVVDDSVAPLVAAALNGAGVTAPRVLAASAPSSSSSGARLHAARPDDPAFLQFSSGSLGDPRGVVLTHANLLADITGMLALRGRGPDDVFVSWMPLFHDMGLIGYHLTPIVARARQVLSSPLAFMRDPLSWLRLLSQHRGSITGAPNFALARLLPRLSADVVASLELSALHTFLVGAEPISKRVLDAFAAALAPAGLDPAALCPAYGLAEATLAVTLSPPGAPPRALTLRRGSFDANGSVEVCAAGDEDAMEVVDVGVPLPGVSLRVVDERRALVEEGVIGVLEVQGPSVSSGYFGAPGGPPDRWLDTGDLGFLSEGRLFVTGRQKDVFFASGRNFYAHDVEAVARELSCVSPGAAALVVDDDERASADDVVLFVALRPEADADPALARVHAHVRARLGLSLGRVIAVDKSELPRTTSGKLRRHRLRERLRAGDFHGARSFSTRDARPAESAPSTGAASDDDVEAVREIWAAVLELPLEAVGADDEFRALGGDSFQAVQVHDRAEQRFSASFSPDLLVVGTTPRRMAAFLREARAPAPAPSSAQPRPTTSARARPAPPVAGAGDVAIVGMAVRAPGVHSPAALWRLLAEGRTTFGPVPSTREGRARLLDGNARGSFLCDLERFDPGPFSLVDAEARAMGPAQRLFLEVAFEALAGAIRTSRRVGVFAGVGDDGYARRYTDDPALVTGHSLLGALPNLVAARVSRAFGLEGPALTVDSACSSSLLAVHLACQSLRAGECELAIAGGVQAGLTAELFLSFQRAGLLSSTGRSRPFDDGADGLVPGEAAGAVALKTLERALADGDRVLAVLKGSAMNNDGGALSGTAPSPKGQADVIARAWHQAGLDPETASLVEAHAAGTAIGDAVEVRALAEVFGARASSCPIGSLKGNLGHTLAAAGVLSLLKGVLALEHRQAPPTPGLSKPASRIDFSSTPFSPTLALLPLEAPGGGPLRAGVSSFGLGGTNVHVVLEEAPRAAAEVERPPARDRYLFCFGAPAGQAPRVAAELRAHIARGDDDVAALAAAAGRFAERLPERRAFVVEGRDELLQILDEEARGARPVATPRGKVALVLPGPGSQVPGMGRALFDAEPVFRRALERCADVAARFDIELLPLLFRDGPAPDGGATDGPLAPLHRLELSQPAVFSFGSALAAWLSSLGVEPDLLVGHSAGEYLAAHLAGMLSLEDALGLVIERGRAMAAAAPGRMAAVLAPRADVERALLELGDEISLEIAAVNAPEQVVVSGSRADLERGAAAVTSRGLTVRPLDVFCAAHSSAIAAAADTFLAAADKARFHPPRVPVISTTTADVLPALDVAHLRAHLERPVDFAGAVRRARALGADTFVELGATSGLSSCVRQILDDSGDDVLVVPCGARGVQDLSAPYAALATLVEAGLPVKTSALLPPPPRPPVEMLPYPWQRRRLWIDAPARPLASSPAGLALTLDDEPAIQDHRTGGVCSAPASLLVDVLLHELAPELGAAELSDVVVQSPLTLSPGEARVVEVAPDPERPGRRLLRSRRARGDTSTCVHLSARAAQARGRTVARLDLDAIRARLPREVEGERVYRRLDDTGFVMGPTMRAVRSVALGDDELLATLVSPAGASRGRLVDPALLDGASHAVAAFLLERGFERAAGGMFLGFSLARVRVHRPLHGRSFAYVRLRAPLSADAVTIRYDIALIDDDGELSVEVEDFAAKRVGTGASPAAAREVLDEATRSPPRPAAALPRRVPRSPTGRADLVELVRGLVARRLRRAPEHIPEHAHLVRLGVDSLMAVELVRALEEHLGTKLYATLLFEASSVAAVAERLEQLLEEVA